MKTVVLLIVDEMKRNFDQIKSYLKQSSFLSYELLNCQSVDEALKLPSTQAVDIISYSLDMKDKYGLSGIDLLFKKYPHAALVLVSDDTNANKDKALTAVRKGARNCLNRSEFSTHTLDKAYAIAYERMQAETSFKSEAKLEVQKLARAVSQSSNTIVITDKAGNITYVNEAFTQLTGYTAKEAIGQNPRILQSGLHDDSFYQNMWSVLSSGKTWSGEVINKGKHGNIFYEKATIDPILNQDGEIISYIAVKEDITERKKSEEQLNRIEESHRFLMETMTHGLWTATPDGNINYLNQHGLKMFGYAEEELLDSSWLSILHPEDRDEVITKWTTAVSTGESYLSEQRFRVSNGEYHWFRVEAKPQFIDGQIARWVGISTDINNEKMYRLALEESQDRLRRGYQIAGLESFTYDIDQSQFYWGPTANNIMRIPPSTIIDSFEQLQQYFHPDDKTWVAESFNKAVQEAFSNGHDENFWSAEHRFLHASGAVIWINVLCEFDTDPSNGHRLVKGVLQDITEVKERELTIREQKQLLTNIVNSFDDILFATDINLRHTAVYGNWIEQIGKTKEDFIGKSASEIFGKEQGEYHEQFGREALANGSVSYTIDIPNPDGSLSYYQLKLNQMKDSEGKVIGLLAVGRDISDLKNATNQLIEKEKKLKTLVDASETVLFEYEIGVGGSYYAGRTDDIFEYTNEEMIADNKLWEKCVLNEDKKIFDDAINQFIEEGKYDVTYRIRTRSKKIKWIREISSVKDTEQPNIIRGIAFDITSENNLLDLIKKSESDFRRIFENTAEGYLLAKPNGSIVRINPSGRKLLEISDEQLEENLILNFGTDVILDQTLFSRLKRRVARKGRITNEYVEAKSLNGKNLILSFTISRIHHQTKRTLYEVFFHDVGDDYLVDKLTSLSNEIYKKLELLDYQQTIQYSVDSFEKLTNSTMAFFHLVNADQETISLQQWSTNTKMFCQVPDLEQHYPISQAGVWVECVKQKQPVVHNDYQALPNKRGLPEGHAYMTRDLEVPILENDKVVAIIGVANKAYDYTQYDIELLRSFSVTFWSILQRKKEAKKLYEKTQQYQSLISNVRGIVYQCSADRDFTMFFISDACLEITGYSTADYYNNKNLFGDIIHPDDKDEVWYEINKSTANERSFNISYRLITKKGDVRWVMDRGSVKYSSEHKQDILEGVITDITDRVKHQEELLSVTLDTELNERSRISKELHDGLQQTLSSSYLHFETLAKRLQKQEEKNERLMLKVRELLHQSVQEAREIAHRLLPKILEDHSLLHALNDLFDENEQVIKINFNHNLDQEDIFEKNVEHALYRIIQEALTNVLKYAQATKLDIQLMAYNDRVIVTLDDNGVGFDLHTIDLSKSGFGLRSMKSRADSVGGYCQVDSSKGRGTHILINIPISIEE